MRLDLKVRIVKTGSSPRGVHCETGFLVGLNSSWMLATKLLIVIHLGAVDLGFVNSAFIQMKFWTCSEVYPNVQRANIPGLNKHSTSSNVVVIS